MNLQIIIKNVMVKILYNWSTFTEGTSGGGGGGAGGGNY